MFKLWGQMKLTASCSSVPKSEGPIGRVSASVISVSSDGGAARVTAGAGVGVGVGPPCPPKARMAVVRTAVGATEFVMFNGIEPGEPGRVRGVVRSATNFEASGGAEIEGPCARPIRRAASLAMTSLSWALFAGSAMTKTCSRGCCDVGGNVCFDLGFYSCCARPILAIGPLHAKKATMRKVQWVQGK